jgi:4a-hydroxytetrahydrobiopterin dehydratase
MAALSPKQISQRMKSVPGWARRSSSIRRKFGFKGFMEAVDFVNRIARKAEKNDHHPDIDIRWNKVTLVLSTHSEGGLTGKDFLMASACSAIYARHFEPK